MTMTTRNLLALLVLSFSFAAGCKDKKDDDHHGEDDLKGDCAEISGACHSDDEGEGGIPAAFMAWFVTAPRCCAGKSGQGQAEQGGEQQSGHARQRAGRG